MKVSLNVFVQILLPFLVFFLALGVGIGVEMQLDLMMSPAEVQENSRPVFSPTSKINDHLSQTRGVGFASCNGTSSSGNRERKIENDRSSSPLQITSKPRPGYTKEAKSAGITGSVRLRVTFQRDRKIGEISPISRLSHGLTEQAIRAAEKIQFRPPTKNGKPYSVRKTLVFNFRIY